MCDVCKEITQNGGEVSIYKLEDITGYFRPENEMIIRFCPCCGEKLNDTKQK